ncbi:MAG: PAS domain-containing protein [Ferruginibacter sp.]
MRKLKQYDERLKLALANGGDNYWEHDFSTGKTFFSNNIYEFLGYTKDEYPDSFSLWRHCIHPDDRSILKKNAVDYKLGAISNHNNEYRVIQKNGKVRWLYDRGVVIERDEEGMPLLIIGTHIEITERRFAQTV